MEGAMAVQVVTQRVVNSWVAFAALGDEAVLLNSRTGVYFGLDEVGTRIWTLIVEGKTDEQIHACLVGEYDVTADALRADLARFLDRLEERELVTRSVVDEGS
jgi:hypothetical protein